MQLENLIRKNTCCFTGYRPHKFPFSFDKRNEEYNKFEDSLLSAILKSYHEGYTTFLSGGAMGFDILAGEMVLLAKQKFPEIKLICIIPFEEHGMDFASHWKNRYINLISAADDVMYLNNSYRQGCYQLRNKKLVDLSNKVITYFSGKSGGTAQTVAYAELCHLEILNLNTKNEIPKQLDLFVGEK